MEKRTFTKRAGKTVSAVCCQYFFLLENPNEKVWWHSRVAQGVTASHRPDGVLLATVGLYATEKQFPKNYDEKNMSPTLTNPCL